MAQEVTYDIDELRKMKKKINQTKIDIEEMRNTLTKNFITLREKWNTPAGKSFFASYDVDWSQQVNQYIRILGAVEELLQVAISKYQELDNKAKAIKF